ncbi:hypothetical protein ACIOGZ_08000 [Kitasatospora sp. NPDC088160]|uniref:hypothetical protein n=1 Tax=Kitasatospora sp. NPDC088160 TaxID=3364072 RepID=UPI0037F849B5
MADEGRITVTIKYGKSLDDSWAVFRGSAEQVEQDIASFFGLNCESVTNLSLSELVVEATQAAQSTAAIVRGLGARIIPQPASGPTPPQDTATGGLLEQIERCASTDALKALWATNQAAFADQAVMDSWKARGRALKAAA